MTIRLTSIIRDLERILQENGYDLPTSIGLTERNAEILKLELEPMLRYHSQNIAEDICRFHGIELIAPKGFLWK